MQRKCAVCIASSSSVCIQQSIICYDCTRLAFCVSHNSGLARFRSPGPPASDLVWLTVRENSEMNMKEHLPSSYLLPTLGRGVTMYVNSRQNMATSVCRDPRPKPPTGVAWDKNVFFCSCSASDKDIQLRFLTWDTAYVCVASLGRMHIYTHLMLASCGVHTCHGFKLKVNKCGVCVFLIIYMMKKKLCVWVQPMLSYVCIPFKNMYTLVVTSG